MEPASAVSFIVCAIVYEVYKIYSTPQPPGNTFLFNLNRCHDKNTDMQTNYSSAGCHATTCVLAFIIIMSAKISLSCLESINEEDSLLLDESPDDHRNGKFEAGLRTWPTLPLQGRSPVLRFDLPNHGQHPWTFYALGRVISYSRIESSGCYDQIYRLNFTLGPYPVILINYTCTVKLEWYRWKRIPPDKTNLTLGQRVTDQRALKPSLIYAQYHLRFDPG